MRTMLRTTLAALLATGVVGAASLASAQSPDAAKRFLEQRHERVNRVLQRAAGAARDRQLSQLLDDLLDYEALSEASLGDHWEAHSESERAEFVGLLKQLVERSYKANLQRTLDYRVAYEGAERRGEKVVVRTSARSRENRRAPAVSIDYEMRQEGREWRVVNVVTDGQSLVQSYRSQFHRILERDGWDGLMGKMRERLNAGG